MSSPPAPISSPTEVKQEGYLGIYRMRRNISSRFFLTPISLLLLSLWVVTINGAKEMRPPTVQIFEVDGTNRIAKVLTSTPNSETTLEGVENFRLECTADYPIQWVYSGNGVPIMENSLEKISSTEYQAVAFIKKAGEQHTGKYKCASTKNPSLLTYLYVYVPGSVLFNTNSGEEVDVTSNGGNNNNDSTSVQIPCTASSPKVRVYLQKPVGDPLVRPAMYDPRRGFIFVVEDARKAAGTYICKGSYRGLTNVLEYKVTVVFLHAQSPASIHDDPNTGRQNTALNLKTETESDVPCNPPCAQNAKCLLQGGQSVCQCLAPYKGDPYGSCVEAECGTHTDCPDNNSCFADLRCRDPCVHSLHGLNCGNNAICKTVQHRPTCACPGGHTAISGDPAKGCYNPYQQGDSPSLPSTQRPSVSRQTTTGSTSSSRTSSSTPRPPGTCNCGNNPLCECICRSDDDCGEGKICNGTVCQDPCDNLCGSRATCQSLNGVGYCSCPRGYLGDPWKRCYPATEKLSGSSSESCRRDSDCPSKYTCDRDTAECIDPCSKCVQNAECDLYYGQLIPSCRCPEGFTGDGTISCSPDATFDIPNSHSNIQKDIANKDSCSSINCGPNSECRKIDDLPKCFCISGYVGHPPDCKAECTTNKDCRDNQVCVQKKCRSACHGKCGRFARCSVDKDTRDSRAVNCTCRRGFRANPTPEIECVPIEPRST